MVRQVTGKIIAMEGIDGSGKSTQTRLVAHTLSSYGYKVNVTSEPTDGPTGTEVRERYLSGKEKIDPMGLQRKFTEDRMWHMAQCAPLVSAGNIVLTDRYYPSSVAYGYASINENGAADRILEMNVKAVPRPDMICVFDISPELAIKRLEGRNGKVEIFEKRSTLEKVREGYRVYFPPDCNTVWIDATRRIDEITGIAVSAIMKMLRKDDPH